MRRIVITGLQIRVARNLLGWDGKALARACKLRPETLARAESFDGEAPITVVGGRGSTYQPVDEVVALSG
jgi:hypothetical protein